MVGGEARSREEEGGQQQNSRTREENERAENREERERGEPSPRKSAMLHMPHAPCTPVTGWCLVPTMKIVFPCATCVRAP